MSKTSPLKLQKGFGTYHNPLQDNNIPFTFRHRTLGLDWRKVACIDCDEIRETGNVEVLQDLIFTITFCNIDSEFVRCPLWFHIVNILFFFIF